MVLLYAYVDPAVAIALIEAELGGKIDELYASFEASAFASASIGQVHHATTHEGQSVVAKVQHAGIEEVIENDLEIMEVLAGIAEQQSERLKQYRPVLTVHEFQKTLLHELNFSRELHNMQRFRTTFANERGIRFAEPYPKLSSRRVLTMERFEGISLSDKSEVEHSGLDHSGKQDLRARQSRDAHQSADHAGGTAHQLSPQFSVAELIQPYGKKALRNRHSLKTTLRRLKANVEDWEHLLTILPRDNECDHPRFSGNSHGFRKRG